MKLKLLLGLALAGQLQGAALTRGPYLQQATDHSIILRWRTDSAEDSRVRYGSSPGSLTLTVSDGSSLTEHRITLTGLAAAQRYYYAVGSGSGDLAGDDSNHFFDSYPNSATGQAARIWVLGDAGTGTATQSAVRDSFLAWAGSGKPDLVLQLGDNAYPNGSDGDYQGGVFAPYSATLRNTAFWSCLGNHETLSGAPYAYFDIYDPPRAGEAGGPASGSGRYYSFNYGSIHFISLDSMDSDRSTSGAMYSWLQSDLAACSKDWIIAFWHHPPYSRGSHNSNIDQESKDMRANFGPLLESYGVDLVLSGHSHSYERSFFIDGHYGLSGLFDPLLNIKQAGNGREDGDGAYAKASLGQQAHTGAVYAVAGSAGLVESAALDHPAMCVSLAVAGSLALDALPWRLDGRFIDSQGQELDHFTLLKGPQPSPGPSFTPTPTRTPGPPKGALPDTLPLHVAPQPARSGGLMAISSSGPIGKVWLYNLAFERVAELEYDGTRWRLPALPGGIYFLKAETLSLRPSSAKIAILP